MRAFLAFAMSIKLFITGSLLLLFLEIYDKFTLISLLLIILGFSMVINILVKFSLHALKIKKVYLKYIYIKTLF